MSERVMNDYLPIRQLIPAVLILALLTACAGIESAEKKDNLASPRINNEAEAMGENTPPVFNEGVMVEEYTGQSFGAGFPGGCRF